MPGRRAALFVAAVLAGCGRTPPPSERAGTTTSLLVPAPPSARVAEPPPAPRPPPRPQLDGRAFPDRVLALTWDDGPDRGTLELARYLREAHVSATFFVVGAWVRDLSAEPGQGPRIFATGHEALPILDELTALGHRLGNHTRNHVLLTDTSPERVMQQLGEEQRAIEPHQKGWLRLFRAPGGAWSAAASAAVDGDPALSRLLGPVRWDIDGKDWEGSVYCRSESPAVECEREAPARALRVKAAVTAQRYLAQAESAGHGIVLLHDRVGHVGSRYALDVARALVPALEARGFVFAAPVLRFSPLAARPEPADSPGTGAPPGPEALGGVFDAWAVDPASIRSGDINGDGRADVCGRGREGLVCALSNGHGYLGASLWLPEMSDAAGWRPHGATLQLADIDGDGRADACGHGPEGWACATAP